MSHDHALPGPKRIASTDTYDGAVSQLVHLASGDVLLFYHMSEIGHVAPDGRLVVRRSTDQGRTWSDPMTVIDEERIDPSSFSAVYYPDSNRLVVFAVGYVFPDGYDPETFPEREFVATHKTASTDGGRTWSDPEPIDQHLGIETATPFGGSTASRHGCLTVFQSDTHELEALFSSDGGLTWENSVFIASSPDGHQLAEPVPCAVTSEKTLIFGRDNETGGFYAIRSQDGGLNWGNPLFFNPTGSETPNPIWVKRTGPNELTAVWGDRTDRCVYQSSISAQLAWQDPTALSTEPRKRLHRQIGDPDSCSYWDGDAGDFGYPTFVQLGTSRSDCLVVCYDGSGWPNLWQMTLY